MKVFLPILVIFSSAFRVIASSPLLSDLIQGVCNDITVFTEYYSAKYTFGHINQCTVEIIARVKILMLIITAIIIIMSAYPLLRSRRKCSCSSHRPSKPQPGLQPPSQPYLGEEGLSKLEGSFFSKSFQYWKGSLRITSSSDPSSSMFSKNSVYGFHFLFPSSISSLSLSTLSSFFSIVTFTPFLWLNSPVF